MINSIAKTGNILAATEKISPVKKTDVKVEIIPTFHT